MINFLYAQLSCPACGASSKFEITFEYGHCRLYNYQIGDFIHWVGDDGVGDIRNKFVRVDAVGGPCRKCEMKYLDFDIFIRDNVIEKAWPVVGRETIKPAECEVLNEADYFHALKNSSS